MFAATDAERWEDDRTEHEMFFVMARWLATGETGMLAVAPRDGYGPGTIINHLEDNGFDVMWLIPVPHMGDLPEVQMEELLAYLEEEE